MWFMLLCCRTTSCLRLFNTTTVVATEVELDYTSYM
jgi:hypothetical protein